ncbi:hypothetical protein C2E21_2934 [Chlorella sorokiniana]|uniref:POPDC1-3 domain-containing protein n=1 Tax=Chlorella sorokiniana TaxID=3076 RepID=A0A2P6TWE1_CHLSO|nr:hypothetical protein C2E21_2934 [Chlorella sorokiniana]|eukprot:PRW58379.1 hypothetical protein C2E21_2934 [Chlorella sorokiniana]
MVVVYTPAGPAAQLANFCFLMSALVSADILLIRFFLCLAYIWLLVNASLGMPRWPAMDSTGGISVDGITWSVLCLLFHGYSLARLVWDERPVGFRSEDEEQLWRFFYRRCGMGRLEMKQVLRYGRWVRVPAGQAIMSGTDAHLRFYVLVEGLAALRDVYEGTATKPRTQFSSCCFSFQLLSIFGIYTGFERRAEHVLAATAVTDCLLYSWSVDELQTIATGLSPAVSAYWRYFSLCQMGLYFSHRAHPGRQLVCATGEPEGDEVWEGHRSRDFTDGLRRYESQRHTLKGFLAWLRRAFHPFPPAGLRHNTLPIHGILARNRLIAVKAAQAGAAIRKKEGELSGSDEEAEDRSVRGERRALQFLTAMQSLQRIDATSVEELVEDVLSHTSLDAMGASSADAAAALADSGGGRGGANGSAGEAQPGSLSFRRMTSP